MFSRSTIPHNYLQHFALHGKEEEVDGGRACESMMTTLREGTCRWGSKGGEFAGRGKVLTVRAARQSSRQRRVSEGGLAVRGGRA